MQALAVGPGVVYAGTQSGGAFKSTDGGESWTAAGGGNQGLSIRGLALHPSDGRKVLAATIEGVFRTVDGGDRWTRTVGSPRSRWRARRPIRTSSMPGCGGLPQ